MPEGKALPQARTYEEFQAYQKIIPNQAPAALEAQAREFSSRFPTSELRYLPYYEAMLAYRSVQNVDKAIAMGRNALAANPDEPVTLALIASLLVEHTRDDEQNRETRRSQAVDYASTALRILDSDMITPPEASPEQVQASKSFVRSIAYAAIGTVQLERNNFAAAEKSLKQAMDAVTGPPDIIVLLRYSIALDQQKKYAEAVAAAREALRLSPEGTPQAQMARQEVERLQKIKN